MSICPLCNGLVQTHFFCPSCDAELMDTGLLENYWGPYSPYLDEIILDQIDGVGPHECIHLFKCPSCGYDKKYLVKHLEELE